MNFAKKMALVDPRMLQHMQQSPVSINPVEAKAYELDEEMRAILNQSGKATKEKMVLYQDVLQKYLHFQDKLTSPPPLPPSASSQAASAAEAVAGPSSEEVKEEEAGPSSEEIAGKLSVVDATPKPLRNKAKVLLRYLDQNSNVSWTKNGELRYKGKTIPHTHMVDLVQDTLRKRKTHTPHGWEQFAYILKESHVPWDVVGNLDRWEWIQKDHSDFVWPTTTKKAEKKRRGVAPSKDKKEFRWRPY